jgi:hypothetical protein
MTTNNQPNKTKKNSTKSVIITTPPKKKFKAPVSKVNSPVPTKQKNNQPKLVCLGWSLPLRFELYMYEKSTSEDAYTYGMQKYLKGEFTELHEPIERANFVRVLTRRVPFSDDETMKNKNGYRRLVFVRYPPGDQGSTSETRQEGLNALKSFLMDKRFSEYPPNSVETEDLTDEGNYASLDNFLLNADIEELMRLDIPAEALDENFRAEYTGFAESCWTGPNFSPFAESLGFVRSNLSSNKENEKPL